jgi:hypothetical protein
MLFHLQIILLSLQFILHIFMYSVHIKIQGFIPLVELKLQWKSPYFLVYWNTALVLRSFISLSSRTRYQIYIITIPLKNTCVHTKTKINCETLVNFYQTTWRYNPEHSHLRNHLHQKLKSYLK